MKKVILIIIALLVLLSAAFGFWFPLFLFVAVFLLIIYDN